MSMTILIQTLKDHWKGTTILAALLFVWMLYITVVYPTVANINLNEMMNSTIIQAVYGKGPVDLNTFDGYMTTKAMLMFGLIFGGYIAWLAATFLSGEVEHNTIDLLLSLPVKRESLVLARYLSLLPVILLMLVAGLAGVYFGIKMENIATDFQWYGWAMLYIGLFGLAFGAISLLISSVLSNGRQAALISIGLMFAMYFTETIGSVMPSVGIIRRLSLFHYVNYIGILGSHQLNQADAVILIVIAVVFLALTIFFYRYREINVS
ncbi:MAG TPA: ABC transporter permease subunit [Methanocella sp.]|nr:ABC transporter permease subunit [Methanocella sp.]